MGASSDSASPDVAVSRLLPSPWSVEGKGLTRDRMRLRHYLEQGTSKSALARQLGVSRNTIYDWVLDGDLDRDLDATPVRYGPRAPVATELDPYKPIIEARQDMATLIDELEKAFRTERT
jgi:transposase